MGLYRLASRAALGCVFLASGLDVLRRPDKPASTAGWLFDSVRERSGLPLPDDRTVVRANAVVQVGAAASFVADARPRLSAAVLIASLVPTTIGGHAFWRFDDAAQRKAQRLQFTKNIGLLGGLLLAVADRPDTHRRAATNREDRA